MEGLEATGRAWFVIAGFVHLPWNMGLGPPPQTRGSLGHTSYHVFHMSITPAGRRASFPLWSPRHGTCSEISDQVTSKSGLTALPRVDL